MLLNNREEVAPTLASFYALGAERNGWLFHRSIAGQAVDSLGGAIHVHEPVEGRTVGRLRLPGRA